MEKEDIQAIIKDYLKEHLTIEVLVKSEHDYDIQKHLIESVEVNLKLDNEVIDTSTAWGGN